MGRSDTLVIEDQKKYLICFSAKFFDRNKIKTIAHLGLKGANSLVGGSEWAKDTTKIRLWDGAGTTIYDGRQCDLAVKFDPSQDKKINPYQMVTVDPLPRLNRIYPNAKHDYYDIQNKNFDINKEWGIKGYDMVICFRTALHVENKDHFLEQIKLCIKNNKHVVFDLLERSHGYSGLSISLKDLHEAEVPPKHRWTTYNPLKRHSHNYMYFSEE